MKSFLSVWISIQYFLCQVAVAKTVDLDWENEIQRVMLGRIAFDYSSVKSPKEFLEKYGAKLSKRDSKFLEMNLAKLKILPELRRNGQVLYFGQTSFEIVSIKNRKFKINGIEWLYRPTTPLEEQVRKLNRHQASGITPFELERIARILLPAAQGENSGSSSEKTVVVTALKPQIVELPRPETLNKGFTALWHYLTNGLKQLSERTTEYSLRLEEVKCPNESEETSSKKKKPVGSKDKTIFSFIEVKQWKKRKKSLYTG